MLEFIFFHREIAERFTDFLSDQGIESRIHSEGDAITVSTSEEIDDDTIDRIEAEYDRLLDLSRERVDDESSQDPDNYQKTSLLISLKNGEKSCVHLDSQFVNRLLQVVSTEELNRFIESVVDAVENPDDRSYCRVLKDEYTN